MIIHARLYAFPEMTDNKRMTSIRTRDYTGYSEAGLDEAIENALQKAGEFNRVEVIETRSSHFNEDKKHYQVTLTTFNN